MSRTFPFNRIHALGLVALVSIEKGDGTINFTTARQSVTVDSVTYLPAEGADVTGVQFPSDTTPANVDVQISALPTGIIQPGDGLRGLLDGWNATVKMFDLANPSLGSYTLITGTVGSVSEDARGIVTIAINGALARAQEPLTEHYSMMNREDLGDDRCKIPILPSDIQRNTDYVTVDVSTGLMHVDDCYGRVRTDTAGTPEDYANVYYECTTAGTTDSVAPTYDPTVGNTTTDGTAVFTARDAWLRAARATGLNAFQIQLASIPDPRASGDDTWYAPLANIYVRSGPLSGTKIPITAWDSATLIVTLATPFDPADIPADTQIEIHRGCDGTAAICNTIFDNIINRRGEEFVPNDITTALA